MKTDELNALLEDPENENKLKIERKLPITPNVAR
jgi:hypothetical protein